MRFTKGLGYGLAGVLLAGMLLATAISTAEGQVDDSPMTIPVGAVGDKVTYAEFNRTEAHTATASGSVKTTGQGPSGPTGNASDDQSSAAAGEPTFHGFVVEEKTTMADRTGMVHDVIRVVRADVGAAEDPSFSVDLVHFVDLETRDIIRADARFEGSNSNSAATGLISIFRPNETEAFLYYEAEPFRLQGETIRLGQDVTDLVAADQVAFLNALDDIEVLEARSVVSERALVDDVDAYGIYTELRVREIMEPEAVRSQVTAGSESVQEQQATASSGDARLREGRLTQMMWVTASSPYPVLIEEMTELNEDGPWLESGRTIRSLAAYEAGASPIPWGEDRADVHYRDTNVDAERTDGPYPRDGIGSTIPYPLETARAAVLDDPSLLQFQLWRQQNPGHQLVEFEYRAYPDEAGVLHFEWTLLFGVPAGDGYQVTTERMEGVPGQRSSADGYQSSPRYTAGDLPTRPVTLAEAERFWSAVADSHYDGQPPNYVQWGGHQGFDTLEIGFDQSDFSVVTGEFAWDLSVLTIGVEDGNLQYFQEMRFESTLPSLVPGGSVSPSPRIQAKTVPAGVQPPEVAEAALVTTSLLAVFLAVYFWPVLKYGAGAAFLGGYAKIKKDEVLDNEVRAQIHQAIQNDPGVNASEVGRRVDAGWGTVVYHLRVLEKNGYVSSLVDGRHKRFFPVGEVDWSKRGQIAALRNPKARTIYEAIAEDPGIIQGDLAGVAGISVPAAIWHLKRLEDAGLVGREKKGRKVHYYANEAEQGRGPEAYDPDDAVEVA